jgi:hypothetical protein
MPTKSKVKIVHKKLKSKRKTQSKISDAKIKEWLNDSLSGNS